MKNALKFSAVSAAALTLILTGCSSPDNKQDANGLSNDGCTQVVVATSSEKVNLMEDLGQKFKESAEHDSLSECATVTAVNVASGKASELLSESVKEWNLEDVPAPTIWSPASTVWTDRVASIAGANSVAGAKSFAKTPVVFGMPESMAKALDYPNKDIGIKDLQKLVSNSEGWGSVGKPIWGSFKIAKTNPNSSTTGLSTILMQSYAASGKSKDLTPADVKSSKKFSESFESGAIHYGDTTGKVLLNLAERSANGSGSSYVSAIALEETSLYNYNIGNPDSHAVQPGETLTPPREKLVAVYPKEGTIWSDNPAVVLGASWVSPEQKEAGEAFVKFLGTKAAQETLPEYGFRSIDNSVDVSKHLNASVGIDPKRPSKVLPKPSEATVSAALDQWGQIRKPSAILELIDISGSMDSKIKGGGTRLEAAITSSKETLNEVRPTDEIGIWAFTTGLASKIDGKDTDIIAEVRKFGALGSEKEQMRNSINDLQQSTRSGTPLYDAVAFGYDYMKKNAETGRINAMVVISDGEDTDSTTSLNSLIQLINEDNKEGGNNKQVKIFAIGFGENADMTALENLAKASGGQSFDATDPTKIQEVLRSVMNNF